MNNKTLVKQSFSLRLFGLDVSPSVTENEESVVLRTYLASFYSDDSCQQDLP